MDEPDPCCVVITSTSSEAAAEELAQKMVEAQLAACVQVFAVQSFYVWQGESRRDAEYLLLIKTRAVLYPALEAFIASRHPYETPELIQVPITAGSRDYLQWLRAGTRGG